MAYLNGRIPTSALTAIGDGLYMEHNAAVAWISARAAVFKETGIMPIVSAPDGAYRTYDRQVWWKNYYTRLGTPRLASTAGYSTHGTGISLDINNIGRYNLGQLEAIMARFGYRRNIPFESWHFTHDGTTIAGTTGTQIGDDEMAAFTQQFFIQLGQDIIDGVAGQKGTTLATIRNDIGHRDGALGKIQAAIANIQPGTTDLSELLAELKELPAETVAALKAAL